MMEDIDIYKQYMYNYPHKKAYRNIKNINMIDLKDKIEKNSLGFYIHIPFCKNKCGYCNLFSLSGENNILIEKYILELEKEAQYISENFKIKISDFTIGGGTPLYLSEKELEIVLNIPKKYFEIDSKEIFTCIETSPKETTEKKLKILKNYNVSRVSIGVQSFLDSELISLKRNHNEENIKKALDMLTEHKFPILNIDLIYGIEKQTEKSFLYSIDRALEYKPDEIFLYPLYIRENKCLKSSVINKYKLYEIGRDYLTSKGYTQKTMRKFSLKDNKENMCGFSNSISIGSGGRSYIDNLHYCRPYSDDQKTIKQLIENYIDDKDKNIIKYGFYLNEDEKKRALLIKNLFVTNGLNTKEYTQTFNSNIFIDFPILKEWIEKNLYIMEYDVLKPTKLGLSLADSIGPKLISEDVLTRMENWIDKYEK